MDFELDEAALGRVAGSVNQAQNNGWMQMRQGLVTARTAGAINKITATINGVSIPGISCLGTLLPSIGVGVWIIDFSDGRWLCIGNCGANASQEISNNSGAGGNTLTLNAQDGVSEGGQLQWNGAGAYGMFWIDNFQGSMRVYQNGGVRLTVGTNVTVSDHLYVSGNTYATGNVYPYAGVYIVGTGIFSNNAVTNNWFRPWDGSNMHIKCTNGNLYQDSTTHYYRNADSSQSYSYLDNNGYALYGERSYYFASYGGGWYMSDGTWIRSTNGKGVWLGAGQFGCDGGLTVGYGGAPLGPYLGKINGNLYVAACIDVGTYITAGSYLNVGTTLNVGGQASVGALNTTGLIQSTKSAGVWYYDQSFYANPSANRAGYGFHPGGVAGSIQMLNNTAQYRHYNVDTSGYYEVVGGVYTNASSRRFKQDIQRWPNMGNKGGASINEEYALSILNSIDTHSFKYHEQSIMQELPSSERRLAALRKLNGIKESKGEPNYVLPIHECSDESGCNGTKSEPCSWRKNWENESIGFIAEQVFDVFKQGVTVDEQGLPLGTRIDSLLALSFAAIKSLSSVVNTLTERLATLEDAGVR